MPNTQPLRHRMDKAARHRVVTKATLIGSGVDLSLSLLKILFGWLAHSQALIADGLHSFSDLASDLLVIVASKHASKEADKEHPYGHGRFETLAAVVLALIMLSVAFAIGFRAIISLLNETATVIPALSALLIAAISVVSKEAIYHYLIRVSRRVKSDLLHASAWHSRSDAWSSVLVVIGVGAAQFGFPQLDAYAALGVAVMISYAAYRLAWRGLQQLVDAGLSDERLHEIKTVIQATEGVVSLHCLRSRSLGTDTMLDVHIQVQPQISVSEGHFIADQVVVALKQQVDDVNDVVIHIDPEDDTYAAISQQLPTRVEIIADLKHIWRDSLVLDYLPELVLHYLNGKVHVNLYVPFSEQSQQGDNRAFQQHLAEAYARLPYSGDLKLNYTAPSTSRRN